MLNESHSASALEALSSPQTATSDTIDLAVNQMQVVREPLGCPEGWHMISMARTLGDRTAWIGRLDVDSLWELVITDVGFGEIAVLGVFEGILSLDDAIRSAEDLLVVDPEPVEVSVDLSGAHEAFRTGILTLDDLRLPGTARLVQLPILGPNLTWRRQPNDGLLLVFSFEDDFDLPEFCAAQVGGAEKAGELMRQKDPSTIAELVRAELGLREYVLSRLNTAQALSLARLLPLRMSEVKSWSWDTRGGYAITYPLSWPDVRSSLVYDVQDQLKEAL